jgi:ribosome-associated translation inhibitor RaiA
MRGKQEDAMQTPAEITYRHCEPTEGMRAEIAAQLARLEKFGERITSCRVVVEGPQTRHRNGVSYKVTLFIAMPQHKDVVVNAHDAPQREHPRVAIREAFNEAIRGVEEAEREMRGQVKQHAAGRRLS